jgi:hypothetical protein
MTTDNFCFYLQNRLIQTSQTGGQWYSDTSPFSISCTIVLNLTPWVGQQKNKNDPISVAVPKVSLSLALLRQL